MTVLICPPPTPKALDPDWPLPHPGFGDLYLHRRRGGHVDLVWRADILTFERMEGYDWPTVRQLTEWIVGPDGLADDGDMWTLIEYGPMVEQTWYLHLTWNTETGGFDGEWRHLLQRHGFG